MVRKYFLHLFIYLFCATSLYLLQLCKGEKKPKKGMTCTVHYTGNLILLFLISKCIRLFEQCEVSDEN